MDVWCGCLVCMYICINKQACKTGGGSGGMGPGNV